MHVTYEYGPYEGVSGSDRPGDRGVTEVESLPSRTLLLAAMLLLLRIMGVSRLVFGSKLAFQVTKRYASSTLASIHCV